MSDLQSKQQYLREHIKPENYEEFAEFLQQKCGSLDIEPLSLTYIQELIAQFNHSIQQEEKNAQIMEQSFHDYQTANIETAKQLSMSILQQINQEKSQNSMNKETPLTNQSLQNPLQKQTIQPTKDSQSAVDLLNSVFQKKGYNQSYDNQFKSVEKSFFDTITYSKLKTNQQKINQKPTKPITSDNFKWDFSDEISKKQNVPDFTKQKTNATQQSNFFEMPKIQNEKELKGSPIETKKNFPFNEKNLTNSIKTHNTVGQGLIMLEKDEMMKVQKKQQNPLQFKQEKQQIRNNSIITPVPQKSPTMISPNNCAIKQFSSVPTKKPINTPQKITKPKQFEDVVNCFQTAMRTTLNSTQLNVEINNHEMVKRSFIMPDYVMYYMTVLPNGHVCKRNYEDFEKLRNILQKVYPATQTPYLVKNGWFSESSQESILKQAKQLQLFIKRIIQNPQLRNSRIFEDFITIKEHKIIKIKFKQYQNMQQPKSIQELCLLKGKVTVALGEDYDTYHDKLALYVQNINTLIDSQYKLSQQLSYHYSSACEVLKQLTELFPKIVLQTQKFNKGVNIYEISNFQNIFPSIKSYYEEVYRELNSRKKIIDENVLPFINFEKKNIETITQLINTTNQMKKSYNKKKISEYRAQKIQYTDSKLKYQKTGILEESKNIIVLKYQTGFLCNQACAQAQRMFELMAYNYGQLWKLLRIDNYERCKLVANLPQPMRPQTIAY